MNDFIRGLESNNGIPVTDELAAARKAVEGIVVRVQASDVRAAFEPNIIKAIAYLKAHARGEHDLLLADLKACGVKTTSINAEVKTFNDRLRLVGSDNDNRATMLCDFFPNNSPLPELIIPGGYRISEDGTVKVDGLFGAATLAHGAVVLSGKTEDIDDGQQGLRVSWTEGKGWRHHVIDSDVLMDTKKFGLLKGYGVPLEITTLREMCSYLLELEARNKDVLPVTKTARSFGWQNNGVDGFLAGRDFVKPDGEVIRASVKLHAREWENDSIIFKGASPGEHQIAEGFHEQGNYGDWVNAVTTCSKYPVVLATILASFVPPLLKILRCPNFVFSLDSDTTHGKSVAQMAAASVWGVPDETKGESVFQTWRITDYALECRANILSGLPLILDDTKQAPVSKNRNFVADVIYKVCGGRGGGKGQPHGLRTVKSWETVLISSGEMPIFNMSEEQHGGTKMRVLGVTALPFGKRSVVTRKTVDGLKDTFLQNYGHAGVKFVQFIIRNQDRWQAWRDEFKAESERYSAMATTENAGRLATYAGAIAIAAKLVHEALELPFKFYQPLDELWVEISRQAEDAQGAHTAWLFFRSYLQSHQNQFHGQEIDVRIAPAQGWLGRWDRGTTQVAVFPHIVQTVLMAEGYRDTQKILLHWKDRGWLIAYDDQKNRTTKPIRVLPNSPTTQMVVLNVEDDGAAED